MGKITKNELSSGLKAELEAKAKQEDLAPLEGSVSQVESDLVAHKAEIATDTLGHVTENDLRHLKLISEITIDIPTTLIAIVIPDWCEDFVIVGNKLKTGDSTAIALRGDFKSDVEGVVTYFVNNGIVIKDTTVGLSASRMEITSPYNHSVYGATFKITVSKSMLNYRYIDCVGGPHNRNHNISINRTYIDDKGNKGLGYDISTYPSVNLTSGTIQLWGR